MTEDAPPTNGEAPGLSAERSRVRTASTATERDQDTPRRITCESCNAFDQFWAIYPRKVGKNNARTQWRRTAHRHHAEILRAATAYADDPSLPEQAQFIPYASKWLSERRWADKTFLTPGHPAPEPAEPLPSPSTRLHAINVRIKDGGAAGIASVAADLAADQELLALVLTEYRHFSSATARGTTVARYLRSLVPALADLAEGDSPIRNLAVAVESAARIAYVTRIPLSSWGASFSALSARHVPHDIFTRIMAEGQASAAEWADDVKDLLT